MKKTLLTLTFNFILFIVIAQNPVPNPGFESWTSGEPLSWTTDNSVPAFPLTQSLLSHTGAYAIRGEVVQTGPSTCYGPILLSTALGNGFSVSQLYPYLKFWYRFNSVSGDILHASVVVYDGSSNPIGGGSFPIVSNASSYVEATAPISYIGTGPSTCIITFIIADSGGGGNYHCGSYFIIDDVQLSNVSGIEESSSDLHLLNVFPNPNSGAFSLQTDFISPSLVITNTLGEKIHSQKITAPKTEINLSRQPAGIYFVQLINEKKAVVRKILVTK